MGRHPRSARPARRKPFPVVPRRGADDRPLPRTRPPHRFRPRRHGDRRRGPRLVGRLSHALQCAAETDRPQDRPEEAPDRSSGPPLRLRPARMAGRGHPRPRPSPSAARQLDALVADLPADAPLRVSPLLPFADWDDLAADPRGQPRAQRRGHHAEAQGRPLPRRAPKGDWWKWKVDPLDHRRGDDLRPAGPRPARQPLHRLHLRGLGRRRARALHQGLFRPYRRRVPPHHRLGARETRWSATARSGRSRRNMSSRSPSRASRKARATSPASRSAFPAWPAGATTSRVRRRTRSTT